MTKRKLLHYLPIVIMLTSVVSLSVWLYIASPSAVIASLGGSNAYGIMFVLAFLGGLTTFSGVPYHLVLIALAAGGANPIPLGLSTAFGVMLGDSTSYVIGYKGREIVPSRLQTLLDRLIHFFMKRPSLLPWFFLAYASFAPFSNDFIVISMGYARYPFWKVMVPLAIGNAFFNIMLAYLAVYGYGFITPLFAK